MAFAHASMRLHQRLAPALVGFTNKHPNSPNYINPKFSARDLGCLGTQHVITFTSRRLTVSMNKKYPLQNFARICKRLSQHG
jgi:hypothetical protein